MKRLAVNVLIVDDNDLDCHIKEPTLDSIKLSSIGFLMADLEKYKIIVYKGKLGKKILRFQV